MIRNNPVMPRTAGTKETKPRAKGAGRKPSVDYAARYAEMPAGETDVLLRGVTYAALAAIHTQAKAEGISVQDWIRRMVNGVTATDES